jgi:predicted dehydrogenase
MTHTLLIYDPGHFHAALLFSRRNHRVDQTLHVYAPPGPDVEKFVALIEGFNGRKIEPTDWRLESHISADALDDMVSERRGEIVILAGRNSPRLALMHRLHNEGFHVLADKPWLTDSADVPHLEAITSALPLAVDIMTGRYDAYAELRNTVIGSTAVFGDLGGGTDQPALEFFSRHHLIKLVDGRPLQRPTWFYDVNVQGDGLVDIQSHYVDQAQWITGSDYCFETDRDTQVLKVERWTTLVPLNLFCESTGEAAFPEYLSNVIENNHLHLACNGQIDYKMRKTLVRQRCEWGLREPAGGGDIHEFTVRGENAELTVNRGPETGFKPEMHLRLYDDVDLGTALGQWRDQFPGLEIESSDSSHLLSLPPEMQTAHEAQFPPTLNWFLDQVESGSWPVDLAARIRTRYTLLARTRDWVLTQ